jgi:hypothetical protein
LGSPRPKSPQKNPKVVSVFHKHPKSPLAQMAALDPNMLKQRPTVTASPSSSPIKTIATTPPLTPLSPEEQAVLIRSLPLLYNVEPVKKIDVSITQSVLDKLKQAEYDNESVSSETERCCYHQQKQQRHGKAVAIHDNESTEIQDKLQHFWSNHRGMEHSDSSDDDNDDDDDSANSAETSDDDDSGLFRY